MFSMGFYLLSGGTHAGFDKHRGAFYWNSADNNRKHRMVKWKVISRPKSLVGLEGKKEEREENLYPSGGSFFTLSQSGGAVN